MSRAGLVRARIPSPIYPVGVVSAMSRTKATARRSRPSCFGRDRRLRRRLLGPRAFGFRQGFSR